MLAEYAAENGLDLGESVAYADSTSDLPLARVRGFPGGGEPRGPPGRRGPAPGLARGAVGQGRWRRPALCCPWARRPRGVAVVDAPRRHGRTEGRAAPSSSSARPEVGSSMKALVFERNVPRFAASRLASVVGGSGTGAGIGPLRLTDVEPPELPGPGWHRVRPLLAGICGSDLATLDGRSSRYFEDIVSFPFVPGHEVVGRARRRSDPRVVSRARARLCGPRHRAALCRLRRGPRAAGVNGWPSGTCRRACRSASAADTGGGWSTGGLVAHEAQLHPVPDTLTDEDAVMVEPTACAVHARWSPASTPVTPSPCSGRGTLGLCTVAALRHVARPGSVLVGAKYAAPTHASRRSRGGRGGGARRNCVRAVRRRSRSLEASGTLSGGRRRHRLCRERRVVGPGAEHGASRGTVVLVGMPGQVHGRPGIAVAPEVAVVGAYAYRDRGGRRRAAPHLRHRHGGRRRRSVWADWCRPATRSIDSKKRWRTPARPGARPVKVVFDLHARDRRRSPGPTTKGPDS